MPLKCFVYGIKMLRVIDGDTLLVNIDCGFNVWMKEYVRLIDVDAPEIRGVNAVPAGRDATLYTTLWLKGLEQNYVSGGTADLSAPWLDGLVLDSRRYDAREKYGRVLGDIYRPGHPTTLNQDLFTMNLIK